MEQITLYDCDKDILIETYVSPEDAERATKDIVFATKLLKSLQEDSNINTEVEAVDKETGDSTQESEASLYRWTTEAVMLLLETYRSMEESFNRGKLSQKKLWENVAKELIKNGHSVTGPQCSSKLRSLKKTYKSVKDHNNTSGQDRRSWQFFEIMDEIFSKKAWCKPVAVASSTGLTSRENNTGESDSGISECSSRSNKITVTSLLGKRLKQREEHEKAKIKRHEEKMEMERKMLDILEKMANK